jgi:HAMP domain-containing protein
MTDIRSTIVSALNDNHGIDTRQYAEYIDTVKDALVDREYLIADRIIEVALGETSYDREAIENLLSSAGLTFRPRPEPVVEEEPAADEVDPDAPVTRAEFGTLAGAVNKMSQLLEKLVNEKAADVF